jgi:hypothetical protein
LVTDRFAIAVANAFGGARRARSSRGQRLVRGGYGVRPWRLIDIDAKEALLAYLPFHVHNFETQRASYALGRLANPVEVHTHNALASPQHPGNKKVGSRPLERATRFTAANASINALTRKIKEGRRMSV